mgnify:CR=1 FL=1
MFFALFWVYSKGDIDMGWQKAVLLLLPKIATDVAKNFRSCKWRSQLSVDIFMASGNLLVAQKDQFLQKYPQKKVIQGLHGYRMPRYRFRVQNNSKTPQEPISGHISSFWPISAAVSKIEFLAKIAILAIFTYFWLLTIWPTIWPEMLKNAIRGRKWPLRDPKTSLHTLDDL